MRKMTKLAIHHTMMKMKFQSKMSHQNTLIKMKFQSKMSHHAHTTLNDINTIEQINTAQINMDPETGDEIAEDSLETSDTASNNKYNLWTRPTRRDIKYTLLQNGQQSTKFQSPTNM